MQPAMSTSAHWPRGATGLCLRMQERPAHGYLSNSTKTLKAAFTLTPGKHKAVVIRRPSHSALVFQGFLYFGTASVVYEGE